MNKQKEQSGDDALGQLKRHAFFLSLVVVLSLVTLLFTSLFGLLQDGEIAQKLAEYTLRLYNLF